MSRADATFGREREARAPQPIRLSNPGGTPNRDRGPSLLWRMEWDRLPRPDPFAEAKQFARYYS